MIKFLTLSIRNFLSYGNNTTKLKLDFTKPTLITGKNYDAVVEGQITSNGAGKSTILNAIAYCLYDKTISNIALDDLVNYLNAKNMEVSVTFMKDTTVYKVERYRKNKNKGGNGIKILRDGVDITAAGSGEANKQLADIIGIPFEIFSRIVVFVASYEPFLSLPASHASKANQRDIIEELFGLVELSEKAEKLKAQISLTKSSLSALMTKNDRILSERERCATQIASTSIKKDTWDEEYNTNIAAVREKIKIFSALDFDVVEGLLEKSEVLTAEKNTKLQERKLLQMQLDSISENNKSYYDWIRSRDSTITKLQSELTELTSVDVDYLNDVQAILTKLESAFSDNKKAERETKALHSAAISSLAKIGSEIEQLSSNLCPYCKQTYTDSLDKLNSCKEHSSNINEDVNVLSLKLQEIADEKKALELQIEPYLDIEIPANLKSIENLIIKRTSELETITKQENPFELKESIAIEGAIMDISTEINESTTKLEDVTRRLNGLNPVRYGVDTWTRANLQKVNSTIDQLADKLKELKKSKNPFLQVLIELYDTLDNVIEKVDTDAVDALATLQEHQEFLLKLLTKKDSFVRKALLNKNIPFLNSRLSHYLSLIGLPHKVLFNEEMGATITQFKTIYEFENLSSGQKARINLALSFAFRDVLQARFSKINFCILDECLDVGLDNVGISLASKMIKAIALNEHLSMLVISHRDEVANMFDKKLEVELRDGFSNVLPGDLLIEDEEAEEIEA